MGTRDYIMSQSIGGVTIAVRSLKKGDGELTQSEQGKLVKSSLDNLENFITVSANEPSLALYRIQEHVRKSVTRLVDRKLANESLNENTRGAIFDTEYALDAADNIARSKTAFKTVNSSLKNAIHLTQQINHSKRQSERNAEY